MACENICTIKGMAVLPVRYAVVPEGVDKGLPGWAADDQITGIELANKESYTLRALRQGYLYVFYEKGVQGDNYWQCYSVTEEGSLWLQTVAANPLAKRKPDCSSDCHKSVNVEFICIESPEKCGTIWFAFSQYPWSEETLNRYKKDSKLRAGRMQKVIPLQWLSSQRNPTGTPVSTATLEDVLDYRMPSVTGLLPSPGNDQKTTLSRADGLWDPKKTAGIWRVNDAVLKQQSTLYPWAQERSGKASATVERIQARGGGTPGLLLPLWDAIGIAHELNGWCQDIQGKQAQFLEERKLEVRTQVNLNALKNMLGDAAQANLKALRTHMADDGMLSPGIIAQRRRSLQQRYAGKPDVLAQGLADCDLLESWRGQGVSGLHVQTVMNSPLEPLAAHQVTVAAVKARVATEEAAWPQHTSERRAESWQPYQLCLNAEKEAEFEKCQQALFSQVNQYFNARMKSVINWLGAPLLLTTLDDFNDTCAASGVFYQSAVTMAMHGIANTEAGAAKLDGWWQECSTLNRENLLWRHVTANNTKVMAEVEPLLSATKAKKDEAVTPLTAGAALGIMLSQAAKLKDYMSYYAEALESAEKLLEANAGVVERTLHQTDSFMATAGNRISRALGMARTGETMTSAMFRMLFTVRAGIPVETMEKLVEQYLQSAPEMRQQVLVGLRNNQRFMPTMEEVAKTRSGLNEGWRAFTETAEGKKTMRLAGVNMLLLVFNAIDFALLCRELKGDFKSIASLTASGLTLVTQTTTWVLPAFEKGVKAESMTLAWIKGVGAATGVAASCVSMFTDFLSARTEAQNNRVFLSIVLSLKIGVDGLTALKFSGSLMEVLGKERAAAGISAFLNYRIFGIRVLATLITWEAQIVILLLQGIAIWISDNDLQVWCKKSVFGVKPARSSMDEQDKKLEEAIKAVL
ncbi:T6SS effector BTH_I2691 family protein [Citrobacter farmeri]